MLSPDRDPAEDLGSSELLRIAQRRISRLLRSLPIGIAIIDLEGSVEAVNPAITSLFSYDERQLVGKNISTLLRKPPWPATQSLKDWYDKHRDETVQLEGWSAENEVVPIDFTIREFDSDGRERLVAIFQDVTQRFLSDKLKQEFVSMISHDIRVPLSGIQAFLDLLRESSTYGTLSELGQQRTELAQKNVQRVLSLVEQVLDLDQLGSGLVNLQKQVINARELLSDAAASVSELADAKEIEVRRFVAEDVVFEGDRERLIQVLVNLVANAIDHSSERSQVDISAGQKGDMVAIAVRDYGQGIKEQDKAFIFERFHRGSKKDKKGYGLGLAICREIVAQHSGSIGVDDGPDRGSIFWFEVPVTAPNDNRYSAT